MKISALNIFSLVKFGTVNGRFTVISFCPAGIKQITLKRKDERILSFYSTDGKGKYHVNSLIMEP